MSEKPCFYVENPLKESYKYPIIRATVSTDEYIIFMLAKNGWCQSNPTLILSTPADIVMKAYYFEIMTKDYESTFQQLNKAQK